MQTARSLVANSIALLAATHITAVLGYLFWMLCARSFSASVIGITNTVISAMTLVAILTVSGFVPMLTRLLPRAGSEERSGLCTTSLVVTVTLSGVVGAGAATLMPDRLQAVVGSGWLVALLTAGAVGTATLLVANAALLGVLRGDLSLVGSVVGSVARLGVVVAIVTGGFVALGTEASASHTILIVWIASLMLSVALSVWLLVRAIPGFRFHLHRRWFSRVQDSVGLDHVITLAVRAPVLVIPILAAALFPPAKVGYLAVIAMICSAFLAVAASVSSSLLADCADDPARLRTQALRASRLIGVLLFVPVITTCVFAKEVLGFFGADYAAYSPLLIMGLLSTFPDALISVAVTILRIQGRLSVIAALTVTGAAMSIGGAWLLMSQVGIAGAVVACLASQTIVAIAFVALGSRSLLAKSRYAGPGDQPVRTGRP